MLTGLVERMAMEPAEQGAGPGTEDVMMASQRIAHGEVPHAIKPVRRVGRMEPVIAVGAFAEFVVVWVGLTIALLGNQAMLDTAWTWLLGLPLPIAAVVWVLFLPIGVGLWIWESTWPPIVGILLAGGMIAWTLVAVSGLRRALRRT